LPGASEHDSSEIPEEAPSVGDEKKKSESTTDAAADPDRAAREERARRLREKIKGIIGEDKEETSGESSTETPRDFIERRMHELEDEEGPEGEGRDE
jgi:hypothetical protein